MINRAELPKCRKKADILGNSSIVSDVLSFSNTFCDELYSNEIFEVSIITGGSGIFRIYGQAIPCREGDVFVVPPDVPHNCFSSSESDVLEIVRIMFDISDWFPAQVADISSPEFCYGMFKGGSIVALATLNASAYDAVSLLADSISAELNERGQNFEDAVGAYLTVLFITLARYIGKAEHSQADSGREWHYAGVAVRMITENFSDGELKLKALAEKFYMSKSHFSRLFKEFTGESFSDYLRRVRLNHACKLLRESDMNMRGIADACGMHDIKSFYRNFRKYIGVTPNQYRMDRSGCHPKDEKAAVLLSEISDMLQRGKSKAVSDLVLTAVDEGIPPERILKDGLLFGMSAVGEKFKNNEAYVPEVLVAARAMNDASRALSPFIKQSGVKYSGKACLGTVQGDIHDIGKNLVKMMLEGQGIEVIDLGVDVPAEEFVRVAIREKCDVICCSALLTTTMGVMADVVLAAEHAGVRDKVKIMIGGAPVTEEFCRQIGADAYTEDAASAAQKALEFCKSSNYSVT